ncbi:MAG: choice-of-anchor tandem repeat GloVer-containing protein [Rhodospirillales bacterium]
MRPAAGVVADKAGHLFGTTYTGAANGTGTVYELFPPTKNGASWSEKALHRFSGQLRGHYPQSALTLDADGNLYGVTANGSINDAGTVFALIKPAQTGKPWIEKLLLAFNGKKIGGTPYGGVVFGPGGNLYGTAGYGGDHGAGIVFMLHRNESAKTGWTETVLYSFSNGSDGGYPYSVPTFDAAGNMYGTTLNGGNAGNGVVFKLLPPTSGTAWTEQVLHSFDASTDGNFPRTGVILDANGNLYGTTENGGAFGWGTVFEVSPPTGDRRPGPKPCCTISTSERMAVIRARARWCWIAAAISTARPRSAGTPKGGIAFKLSPPSGGATTWTETILTSFPSGTQPESGFIVTADGKLTGTTFFGGTNNQGSVYQLTP